MFWLIPKMQGFVWFIVGLAVLSSVVSFRSLKYAGTNWYPMFLRKKASSSVSTSNTGTTGTLNNVDCISLEEAIRYASKKKTKRAFDKKNVFQPGCFPVQKFPVDPCGFKRSTIWLNRTELVSKLMTSVLRDYYEHGNYTSHYFQGPPGAGKTDLLHSIGEYFLRLNENGYLPCTVYKMDAEELNRHHQVNCFNNVAVENYKANRSTILLLDEVQQVGGYTSMWTQLLRDTYSGRQGLIVIGVGDSTFQSLSTTFWTDHATSEIMLRSYELDPLTDLWFPFAQEHNQNITRQNVRNICEWVVGYTSGHIYPSMAIIEHFLKFNTTIDIGSAHDICLWDQSFFDSDTFKNVKRRCFADHRLYPLRNKWRNEVFTLEDIRAFDKRGIWNDWEHRLLSPFLYQTLSQPWPYDVDSNQIPNLKEVLKAIVILGLHEMNAEDFHCRLGSCDVVNEDVLSWRWTKAADGQFPPLVPVIQSLEDGWKRRNPAVDFALHGKVKGVVVMTRDNINLCEKLKMLDKDGVYHRLYGGGIVLNIVVTGYAETDVTLYVNPKKWKKRPMFTHSKSSLNNDTVCSPDVFHFVKSENCLYQGNKLVVGNVVENLGKCSDLTKKQENASNANLQKAMDIARLFSCK